MYLGPLQAVITVMLAQTLLLDYQRVMNAVQFMCRSRRRRSITTFPQAQDKFRHSDIHLNISFHESDEKSCIQFKIRFYLARHAGDTTFLTASTMLASNFTWFLARWTYLVTRLFTPENFTVL